MDNSSSSPPVVGTAVVADNQISAILAIKIAHAEPARSKWQSIYFYPEIEGTGSNQCHQLTFKFHRLPNYLKKIQQAISIHIG